MSRTNSGPGLVHDNMADFGQVTPLISPVRGNRETVPRVQREDAAERAPWFYSPNQIESGDVQKYSHFILKACSQFGICMAFTPKHTNTSMTTTTNTPPMSQTVHGGQGSDLCKGQLVFPK